jgi:hypothetical protein
LGSMTWAAISTGRSSAAMTFPYFREVCPRNVAEGKPLSASSITAGR